LAKWDVNHDGKNVERSSVSTQGGERTLEWENQAYVGNGHHDEDVGHNQSVSAQSGSLVDQNYMSDGWVHERTEAKHQKKCEIKHVRRCEEKHESKSKAEHENKNESENRQTHHDMSF
jgi:hypothetical protein